MSSIEDMQKMMGYKEDTRKAYKNFTSYYDEYSVYCRENKIICAISFEDFKEDLRQRDGMTEKCQKFIDLMHDGLNVGQAQKELNMSFDEISIAIDGAAIKNCLSYLGKEYKNAKK